MKEEKEKFAIIGDYLYIYVDGMYNRVANYSTDRDKEDKIYLVDLLNEQLKENQKLEHNWNELKKYVEDRIDTWDTAEIMLSKMQSLEEVGELNDN